MNDHEHSCAREPGDLDDTDVTHADPAVAVPDDTDPDERIPYEPLVYGVPLSELEPAIATLEAALVVARRMVPALRLSDLLTEARRWRADA